MNKKFLLTGSSGFIGRHVLNELIKNEISIRLVVRESKKNLIPVSDQIDSVFITTDLFTEDINWLCKICHDVDTIIHLAWYTEPGKYLFSPKNLDCLIGTLNLAKAAMLCGVKRFIGIGTCFEYDLTSGYLSIDTPLAPLTPYAACKVATYYSLYKIFSDLNIEFTWCRLFYLFGDGEDPRRLFPYIRNNIIKGEKVELTSGLQIRDYMNVLDASEMVVSIALSKKIGPYNICSGNPITIRKIAENIANEYGRLDLLNFGLRLNNQVDLTCIVGIFNN